MSRYQHHIKPAPIGMAYDQDPAQTIEYLGRYVRGFFPGRNGYLSSTYPLQALYGTQNSSNRIQGLAFYYDPHPPTFPEIQAGYTHRHRLVVIRSDGMIEFYPIRVAGLYGEVRLAPPRRVGPLKILAAPYFLRMDNRYYGYGYQTVQYGNELILVHMDGWIEPVRLWQDENGYPHMAKLGIMKPSAPTLSGTSSGSLSGTYSWLITYADEKDRESSPSLPTSTVTLSSQQQTLSWSTSTDNQVQKIYLYRTLNAGNIYYRVAEQGFSNTTTSYTDNQPDSVIVNNTQAPEFGSQDPPHLAGYAAIYQSRLCLNDLNYLLDQSDLEATNRIQISKLDNPTAFSLLDATQVDDAATLTIGSNPGDRVVALKPIGSVLGIFKEKGFYILLGNHAVTDLGDGFTIQYIDSIGCAAPKSLVNGDGKLIFLSYDGIYYRTYESGFIARKISEPIRSYLNGYTSDTVYKGPLAQVKG